MELNDKKFAVLVDADNISHRKIKDILDEIAALDAESAELLATIRGLV